MTNETNEIRTETGTAEVTAKPIDPLDNLFFQVVHEHPFTVSGGALIIGITLFKIMKKLSGK
jgi:hypothetical protein